MNLMPYHAVTLAGVVAFGSLRPANVLTNPTVTHTCRPADAGALELRHYARLLASTDTGYRVLRDSLHIPAATDTSAIVVVTGPSTTCNKAGAAMVSALHLNPAGSRSVYIIDVGTVYIVEDPTARVGDWFAWVVLQKNNFKWLATDAN